MQYACQKQNTCCIQCMLLLTHSDGSILITVINDLRIYSQTTRSWYMQLRNSTTMKLMLESIFKEYYMLETFLFDGNETQFTQTIDKTETMMAAKELRIIRIEKEILIQFQVILVIIGQIYNLLNYIMHLWIIM